MVCQVSWNTLSSNALNRHNSNLDVHLLRRDILSIIKLTLVGKVPSFLLNLKRLILAFLGIYFDKEMHWSFFKRQKWKNDFFQFLKKDLFMIQC